VRWFSGLANDDEVETGHFSNGFKQKAWSNRNISGKPADRALPQINFLREAI